MNRICCSDQKCCDQLNRVIEFLKIIAEENRLRILCILSKYGEKCVCEIREYLDLPQNLTSHHLKVLKDFGLLKSRKEGLNVFYSINPESMLFYKQSVNCFLTKGRGCDC